MDALLLQAMNGTLAAPASSGSNINVSFSNNMVCPIYFYLVVTNGSVNYQKYVSAMIGGVQSFPVNVPSSCYVVVKTVTGAYVCVVTINNTASVTIDCSSMSTPNDIGPWPKPSTSVPLPADSPKVLVACGQIGSTIITREQNWRRSQESYSLPANSTRTIGVTSTLGVTSTSTDQSTVSQTLGLGLNGSWEQISASFSQSLSQTTMKTQTTTLSSTQTKYEEIKLDNTAVGSKPMICLSWGLADSYNIYSGSLLPSATVTSIQSPRIVDVAFNPTSG